MLNKGLRIKNTVNRLIGRFGRTMYPFIIFLTIKDKNNTVAIIIIKWLKLKFSPNHSPRRKNITDIKILASMKTYLLNILFPRTLIK